MQEHQVTAGARPRTTGRSSGLAARLREQTRPGHEAVERRLGLPECLSGPDDLVALLHLWHRVWTEAAVTGERSDSPAGQDLSSAAERALRLIADDLAVLAEAGHSLPRIDSEQQGLTAPGFDADPTTTVASLAFRAEATALGTLYVLLGSQLGGLIVAITAAQRCALSPDRGLRFLLSDGLDVQASWRQFRDRLKVWAQLHTTAEHDAVLASAVATFAAVDVLAKATGWNGATPNRDDHR